MEKESIKNKGLTFGVGKPGNRQAYIDTRDIGDISSNILTESIEKHGTAVYDVYPDVLSYDEKAAILTKVLGKEVKYVQLEPQVYYDTMLSYGMTHSFVYEFINLQNEDFNLATPQIEILLGKKPRTFENWVRDHKNAFL